MDADVDVSKKPTMAQVAEYLGITTGRVNMLNREAHDAVAANLAEWRRGS